VTLRGTIIHRNLNPTLKRLEGYPAMTLLACFSRRAGRNSCPFDHPRTHAQLLLRPHPPTPVRRRRHRSFPASSIEKGSSRIFLCNARFFPALITTVGPHRPLAFKMEWPPQLIPPAPPLNSFRVSWRLTGSTRRRLPMLSTGPEAPDVSILRKRNPQWYASLNRAPGPALPGTRLLKKYP